MQARTCAFILRFLIETLISGPKSYGDFRETGPTGYYGDHFLPSITATDPLYPPLPIAKLKGQVHAKRLLIN